MAACKRNRRLLAMERIEAHGAFRVALELGQDLSGDRDAFYVMHLDSFSVEHEERV